MTNARYSASIESVAVDTDVENGCDTIDYGDFAQGMVHIPEGSSLTKLTWYSSTKSDGTYLPADDASGTAVVQTVAASQSHPIPASLSGARFLRITGDAEGVVGITMKD